MQTLNGDQPGDSPTLHQNSTNGHASAAMASTSSNLSNNSHSQVEVMNHHQNGFVKIQPNDSKLSNTNSLVNAINDHNSSNNGVNSGANSSSTSANNETNGTNSSNLSSLHQQNGNNQNNEENYQNGNNNNNKLTSSNMYKPHSFTNGQKDILRLIGQHLRYLGLNKTTETLIKESDCMLEHPTAANFCSLIMNGCWDEAEVALNNLKTIMEDSSNDITNMKFLILEQKYLECLEDGKIFDALKCLRDELAPLKFNTERLHELSSFLMCSDQLNLKALSKWAGKSDTSRQNLMDKLQTFLPPNIMLPPRRLELLLNQSIEYQCEKCPYHNFKDKFTIDNWSFLRDHVCSKDDFPSVCLQVLNDHCDEVWYCKFSNNGKYLASGSKDGCLIIWDVDQDTYKLTLNKTYEDHSCGVALIEWSPNDRYVLVCGTEESTELWIWDVETKQLKKRMNNSHDDSLTAAAWLPDGKSFVTGGIKGHFYNCDLDGNITETWEGVRVRCLQTLPDGIVLAADSLKRIRSYNFKDISDSNLIQEDFQIMSFTLNKAKTQILASVASQGLHLWDIKDKLLLRRFQGPVTNTFMNYSTFGGADEIYLASGSEDNKVYLWNVKKEAPIGVLEGHTRSVTCVAWNPEIPGMIASASDDGTLRVWGPKSKSSTYNLNTTSNANSNGNNVDMNFNNNSNSDNMRGGSGSSSGGSANRPSNDNTSNMSSGNGSTTTALAGGQLPPSTTRFSSPFFTQHHPLLHHHSSSTTTTTTSLPPPYSSTTTSPSANPSSSANNRSDRSTPV